MPKEKKWIKNRYGNEYVNDNPDNNKEEIDRLNEEEDIIKPTFSGKMEYLLDESVMFFDYTMRHRKRYRLFYGIGVVYRVVKGGKQDLIYINFGMAKDNSKPRLVVAYSNHARRQTMTLKRGQVCQVYGMCRYYMTEFNLNGVKRKGIRLGLYAIGLNGWYVPTTFDIKKMPMNEDLVQPTEKEEELLETFEDVLNDFLNGGEDKD